MGGGEHRTTFRTSRKYAGVASISTVEKSFWFCRREYIQTDRRDGTRNLLTTYARLGFQYLLKRQRLRGMERFNIFWTQRPSPVLIRRFRRAPAAAILQG